MIVSVCKMNAQEIQGEENGRGRRRVRGTFGYT